VARRILGLSLESFRVRLRIAIIAILCSALGGGLYGFLVSDLPGLARGAFTGLIISLPLIAFELFYARAPAGAPMRRLPFAAVVILKSSLYLVVFAAALIGVRALFRDSIPPFRIDADFAGGMAFSVALGLIINFILEIDSLLGRGVLLAFVLGRYHRPREEERVFLFLDIVGSTALAERLGGPRFLELLDRLYHDIAEPIMAHRGDIHKYVGDEAIVTWRLNDGISRADCVRCIVAIRSRLAARAADYEAAFGTVPRFRFGLHCGTVVSGELGDLKREIAFLGDAMNTTARLVEACRERGEACIASGEVIRRVTLPPEVTARPLGAISLRGKAEPLPLYALSVSA
jgi:adenylate cyclase